MATQFYISTSQFLNRQAYFMPDTNDEDKIAFAGFADGDPPYALTTVPSGGYNFNVESIVGYGNANFEKPVVNQLVKGKKGVKQTVVNEFDPSGGMTGNYSMVHQPWPSSWNVYLLRNYQLNSDAFYFNEAGVQASGSYDAFFQVSDFNSTGTIWQMTDNVTWALNPNLNTIFSFTRQ